jgi:hypothetical protein
MTIAEPEATIRKGANLMGHSISGAKVVGIPARRPRKAGAK